MRRTYRGVRLYLRRYMCVKQTFRHPPQSHFGWQGVAVRLEQAPRRSRGGGTVHIWSPLHHGGGGSDAPKDMLASVARRRLSWCGTKRRACKSPASPTRSDTC